MDIPEIEVTVTAGGTITTPFGPKDMPESSVAVHKVHTIDDATIEALKERLGINGAQTPAPLTAPQLAAQYSIAELAQALTLASTAGK